MFFQRQKGCVRSIIILVHFVVVVVALVGILLLLVVAVVRRVASLLMLGDISKQGGHVSYGLLPLAVKEVVRCERGPGTDVSAFVWSFGLTVGHDARVSVIFGGDNVTTVSKDCRNGSGDVIVLSRIEYTAGRRDHDHLTFLFCMNHGVVGCHSGQIAA